MEEEKTKPKTKRNNSRIALDDIRAEQLRLIAIKRGFKTATGFLNAFIANQWQEMHPNIIPPMPGLEIDNWLTEDGESIVSFAANGTLPIRIEATQALQLADGIDAVIDGKQNSFFTVAAIDTDIDKSILCLVKKGNGFLFTIKEDRYAWKRGLTRSLSKELADLFRFHAEQALQKVK